MDFKWPNEPSRCTWKANATNSPHTSRTEHADRDKVMPDILSAIGHTPLVKLNNIPKSYGIKCEIYAKCEFLNPGGSVKDRIAYRMIQDAEEEGLLKPGSTIIEPTSGNTGIGLAMAAAAKGYKCIIVMPEKMSDEKVSTLRALGAEIVRTPTEALWNDPEAGISVAQELRKKIPNSVVLDQYTNPRNPLAHYDQTGTEIWRQCEGKIDYLVAGAGTGGTISGIGRKLKELSPDTKIVAVDPKGSILAPSTRSEDNLGFYEVEGIGYDFIPTVLDLGVIDDWVKTEDHESLNASRMLIRQEGLLCGGSSGSVLVAALKIAKDLPEGKRIVIILADGIRNYLSKFVSDKWMEARGFMKPTCQDDTNKWWWDLHISDMTLSKPIMVKNTMLCSYALRTMERNNRLPIVVSDDGIRGKGIVTWEKLMSAMLSGVKFQTDSIKVAIETKYVKLKNSATLGLLSRVLEKERYVVIIEDGKDDNIVAVVDQYHVLDFITNYREFHKERL